MNVTSASFGFAEELLAVFLSWKLKAKITSIKGKSGISIYRIWISGKTELLKLAEIIYSKANTDDFHTHKRVYMSQHSNKPFYVEDKREIPRWKYEDGKLIHKETSTRTSFRTNISKSLLDSLRVTANMKNTHINYLLESGLEKLLKQNNISFNKYSRPEDRIQYKTTYDNKLLLKTKVFAKENGLFINDVIEYSVQFIDKGE